MTSNQSNPIKCLNKCGFYGHIDSENLCSKCFIDKYPEKVKKRKCILMEEKLQSLKKIQKVSDPPKEKVEVSNLYVKVRCHMEDCNRSVRLVDQYECRCGNIYCKYHKFLTDHDCMYDYRKEHKEKLEKDNPEVKGSKIDFI